MDTIQGYKFNNKHKNMKPPTKFYTIINDLSEDEKVIYFSEIENIHKLPNYHVSQYIITYENLHQVVIPDDSQIFILSDIYKTNKYAITDKVLIKNNDVIVNIMKNPDINNPYIIKFVDYDIDTIYDLCLLAVRLDGITIYYISKQQKKTNIFSYLQYYTLCLIACKQNGLSLRHVLYQDERLCLAACEENGYAIKYVIEQTKAICKMAYEQNESVLIYIEPELLKN